MNQGTLHEGLNALRSTAPKFQVTEHNDLMEFDPEGETNKQMENIEHLKASLAICDAKLLFCQSLDAKDWEGCRNLVTDDFQLDLSGNNGIPPIIGRDTAIAKIRSYIDTAMTYVRMCEAKCQIGAHGADAVFVVQAHIIYDSKRESTVELSHLHEHWVCLNGRWRISHLKRVPSRTGTLAVAPASRTIQ